MKKTYLIPAFKVEELQAEQMLAASLKINSDTTVDGSAALVKGNDWDIFSEDTEEE